jgi:UrcA family protein
MNPRLNPRTSLFALGLLGIGLLAGAAQADMPGETAIKVSYSDLNLTTAAGSQALYGRIVTAARRVCGTDKVDIRDLNTLASAQRCEAQAIAGAVHQVHSPALAALSSARARQG